MSSIMFRNKLKQIRYETSGKIAWLKDFILGTRILVSRDHKNKFYHLGYYASSGFEIDPSSLEIE